MGQHLNILVLSFYYQPDLSAGSFRNTSLVEKLCEQLPANSMVHVVTTLPNRYSAFSAEALSFEDRGKVKVNRVALPAHRSGMLDQSKAFAAYAKAAIQLTRTNVYDLVYASSSRLMTATLGAYIARRKKVPLYLDVRDIFVDTIEDILPRPFAGPARKIFSYLEEWTMRQACKVNLVSAGFLPYFQARYPGLQTAVYTNGIDGEFLEAQPCARIVMNPAVINVLYAGNVGEGQGLHRIIPELAKRLEGKAKFTIIGGGGRLEELRAAVKGANCNNVELLPPVDRQRLLKAYQEADVLFLHLNNHDAFKKVLPSKLFEYAALGKPILAGLDGFAADFVKQNIENAAVFSPCDVNGAEAAMATLELVTEPRSSFVERFARSRIMQSMAADVIQSSGIRV